MKKIDLFKVNNYSLTPMTYDHLLHGSVVKEFEQKIASFVGAKYAVALNSATSAIFLSMKILSPDTAIIPSMIPPVVPNAIRNAGCNVIFNINDINWVGGPYRIKFTGRNEQFRLIDSAQHISKNQYISSYNSSKDDVAIVYSFYPTKPIGGIDGGIIVSDNKGFIDKVRMMAYNGMDHSDNSWDREPIDYGWKMYMSSTQADFALRSFYDFKHNIVKLDYIRQLYNKLFRINNYSYHLYRIRVYNNIDFIKYANKNQITCGIHYKYCHKQNIYKQPGFSTVGTDDNLDETFVSIPFHVGMNDDQVNYIGDKYYEYMQDKKSTKS
ncbi:MAG: hypothetical protein BAJALOKI3v1_50081 [Promethearchaeota archaeon]|nr:MAG: hypothetical protein BAJALOKI3v1_50081 [Candidatus Lokiarchaeota archaeon]